MHTIFFFKYVEELKETLKKRGLPCEILLKITNYTKVLLLVFINFMKKYQVTILYDLICYYINVKYLDRSACLENGFTGCILWT